MKKSIWSMLAIMMVAVLSFSFASCSKDKDDDENNNAKGTYTLSYEMEKGTLTDAEYAQLNGAMGVAIRGAEFKDQTLDEVVAQVNTMIGTMAPQMLEQLTEERSFKVKLFIKNAAGETVKTITIEVENGQIKQ